MVHDIHGALPTGTYRVWIQTAPEIMKLSSTQIDILLIRQEAPHMSYIELKVCVAYLKSRPRDSGF